MQASVLFPIGKITCLHKFSFNYFIITIDKAIEEMMSQIQEEVYSYIDEFKQNGIDAAKLPRKNSLRRD